jgi:hypothetical protein
MTGAQWAVSPDSPAVIGSRVQTIQCIRGGGYHFVYGCPNAVIFIFNMITGGTRHGSPE